MKIAVLGAGNMGLSFSKSFLKYELIKPKNLHLITRSQNKKEKINKKQAKNRYVLKHNAAPTIDRTNINVNINK